MTNTLLLTFMTEVEIDMDSVISGINAENDTAYTLKDVNFVSALDMVVCVEFKGGAEHTVNRTDIRPELRLDHPQRTDLYIGEECIEGDVYVHLGNYFEQDDKS